MTAAAGSIVGLYVDLVAPVAEHDIIDTQSGRRYAVLDVRVQARGKHAGRQHLRALVLDANQDVEPDVRRGARIHRIRWYTRGRGRK